MSDTMSVTDMLSRLRADTADERFDGARLGPTAVRELLRHVDALAARLAEIEAQEPVAWVPMHPRDGALWSMTTATPSEERLPSHYPLSPLYTSPAPAAAPELAEMISAALADARRDGAEVMREACEKAVWLTRLESELPDSDDKGVSGWIEVAEDRVRRSPIPMPMPMPTGERQAALQSVHGFARSIESAVIAANNLEVRRG